MSTIHAIKAREVLDGRGFPTLEVTLWLQDGRSVITQVPTDLSYKHSQAKSLRDNDAQEYNGQGVKQAVRNVNEVIGPQLVNQSVIQQGQIDQALIQLDGTLDRSNLGSNALLAVSMAAVKAGALSTNLTLYNYFWQKYQLTEYLSLPNCIYNIIDGGKYGNGNLDFQEFQIIPASHIDFATSMAMSSTVKQKLAEVISNKGGNVCSGVLGGFLPRLNNNKDVFELILEAIKGTKYNYAQEVFFGLAAGSDDLATDRRYTIRDKNEKFSEADLLEYYQNIRETYKVIYFEDPFANHSSKAWRKLTNKLGQTTKIAGDAFLSGETSSIEQKLGQGCCNSMVIKLLNRSTISETMQLIKMAKDAQLQVVIDQQQGETNEDLLVDLAVGAGADYVKFGPPNRGEKIAKYNRLIRISEELDQSEQQQPQTA